MKKSTKLIIGAGAFLTIGLGGWLIWRHIQKKKNAQNNGSKAQIDNPQPEPFYETIDTSAETKSGPTVEMVDTTTEVYEYTPHVADANGNEIESNLEEIQDDTSFNPVITANKNDVNSIVNSLNLPNDGLFVEGYAVKGLKDAVLSQTNDDPNVGSWLTDARDWYGADVTQGTLAQKKVVYALMTLIFAADGYAHYKPKVYGWLNAVAAL